MYLQCQELRKPRILPLLPPDKTDDPDGNCTDSDKYPCYILLCEGKVTSYISAYSVDTAHKKSSGTINKCDQSVLFICIENAIHHFNKTGENCSVFQIIYDSINILERKTNIAGYFLYHFLCLWSERSSHQTC